MRRDTERQTIDLLISEKELMKRKSKWNAPELNYKWGALAKYAIIVGSATEGAACSPRIQLKLGRLEPGLHSEENSCSTHR